MRTILIVAAVCAVVIVPAQAQDAKSIAVLPFRNSSGQADLDPVAEGLSDLIVVCGQSSAGVTFVERQAIKKILAEQKISLAGLADDKTKVQVGNLLGAKYIVTGGMVVVGDTLKINAHLFDVQTTRVVKSSESEGSLNELLETTQPLAADLMKGIGIELKPLDPSQIDKSPEANLHFMRGLGYYYGNLRNHAIAEFMKALALEPAHAQSRWWLAACYYDQKEWEHAAIEYRRFCKDFKEDPLEREAAKRLRQCRKEMKKGG